MPAPKKPQSRAEAYRRIQEDAAREVAGWPEWKRHATQVPVIDAICHLCNQRKPAAQLIRTALIGTTSIWECRDADACNGQPRSRVRRIL
jgi:hypothetical protein